MSERILFNDSWRFYNADIEMLPSPGKGPSYNQAKTEHHLGGPASINYPDTPADNGAPGREITLVNWDYVTLPHDYMINEPYVESCNNSWGYKPYHPAWYRKHFKIGSEDRGKRIVLYFEGIADYATVYFNGSDMYRSFESHTPFEVDLTDFVRFDEDNVLAIRTECGTGEGWWYQGGGIYRNVWLEKKPLLSVDRYGVYVAPVLPGKDGHDLPGINECWNVPVEVTVRNDDYTEKTAEIRCRILAPDGSAVSETACIVSAAPRAKETAKLTLCVTDPERWDEDHPALYTLCTTVTDVDACAQVSAKNPENTSNVYEPDVNEVKFGFRLMAFDPDKGFFINGKNVKIKGVCNHEDFAFTGRAVPESVERYKASLLKEMGVNGHRCSHYPQSEYWMDEMDRKGIYVMAETRWFTSTESGIRELQTLMKRDRNHPSVIMWSLGNEEPFFITEQGARIARALYAEAKKLDPYRPIITANDRDPEVATVYDYSDLVGVNYHLFIFDKLHEMYPDKAIFSTENAAAGTVRGWFAPDEEKLGRINALDHEMNNGFSASRERTWQFIASRPWMMGGMQWTGFEYDGETSWPRVCSCSGAIDLYLNKKESFYQNLSYWSEKPMIYVMPHWNRPADPEEPVNVWAYTNCTEAELFVNGTSKGRISVAPVSHAEWSVPYEPGELKVVGYVNGEKAVEDVRVTTGKPAALKLTALNADDIAPGEVLLVSCTVLDSEGREVPDAAPLVTFHTNDACSLLGTGSDHCDHVLPKEPVRKMYMGKITAAVYTGKAEGPVKVYASADGLKNAVLTVEI